MSFDANVAAAVRLLAPADAPIHGLRPGAIRLRVRDLARMRGFWQRTIGLAEIGSDGGAVQLGVGDRVIVELEHFADAPAPARNAAGLFHVAVLYDTRADLALALRRILDSGAKLSGASDHLVSEALYLADPEDNGIELYWDRPREGWNWTSRGLQFASNPLDLRDLLRAADASAATPPDAPDTTVTGHVHLKVTDVLASEAWYRTMLGLDLTSRLSGASFVSSDHYHHHIGMNGWASQAGPAAPIGAMGLAHFEVTVSETAADDIAARLTDNGSDYVCHADGLSVRDPSGILVRVRAAG